MDKQAEQKVGLSKLNIILCGLGIAFFSMFIILPPFFRLFFKEEPVEEDPALEQVELSISCFKETEDDEGIKTIQYTITALDDELTMIAYTETLKYLEVPESASWECDALNSSYTGLEGLYYSCQIEEDEKTTDIRVTIPTYQESIPMEIVDYQDQTFDSYYTTLEESGFSCGAIEQN